MFDVMKFTMRQSEKTLSTPPCLNLITLLIRHLSTHQDAHQEQKMRDDSDDSVTIIFYIVTPYIIRVQHVTSKSDDSDDIFTLSHIICEHNYLLITNTNFSNLANVKGSCN